jgi:hypothetical protein
MKEEFGDIWEKYDQGYWIVITTNGSVKRDGTAVMGRGIALQAKQRFPLLPARLGRIIEEDGNIPAFFPKYRIITLPVKHHWNEGADLNLIYTSCLRLDQGALAVFKIKVPIYMVRPGCGNGGLKWEDVKPVISFLSDDFVVIERKA